MPLTTAPIKIKLTREDGRSELRRLGFSFDSSFVSSDGPVKQVEGYHLGLCKYIFRSLQDLYPDLHIGSFSDHAIFNVKDEDGDMVRFDSEGEFVAAMPGFESWNTCLRLEVTMVTPPPTSPTTTVQTTTIKTPTASLETTASPVISAGYNASSPATPTAVDFAIGLVPVMAVNNDPAVPPSEVDSGSVISFESNMSASSALHSSSSLSPPSAAAPLNLPPPSLSPSSTVSPMWNPLPLFTATPAAPQEVVAEYSAEATVPPVAPLSVESSSIPAASTAVAAFGDPSTPAKAFLTQVLPGLADVLARSLYAAQCVPQIMPNTISTASEAVRNGNPNPLEPAAAGLAAAAANTAALTAASVAASVQSANETVQASAEKAATRAAVLAATPVPTVSSVDRTTAPTTGPQATCETGAVPPESTATASVATPESTTETTPEVHSGVACDACDVCPIIGTRYKCAVRNDFDLCEACEYTGGANSPFPYLKIRTPAQAPAAIVCLLKPDQPGSMEEAASASKNDQPQLGNNGTGWKGYAPGQPTGRRSRSRPQHGGWGEGRRNGPRWMKDLARRQQQMAATNGAECPIPSDVYLLRDARHAWCGARMQRRRDSDSTSNTTKSNDQEPTKASGSTAKEVNSPIPPPASVTEISSQESTTARDDKPEDAAQKEATPAASNVTTGSKPAAPALTVATVTEASQSAEYHDMLAASMRSLASSMTASFPSGAPAASTPQQEKPWVAGGNPNDVGKVQATVKPMARFVTDVSVADGSPLPPNTRFVKTWCMRNDGTVTFPPGCRLMPATGDIMSGPEEGVQVEPRAPGEEFHVSATMTTPHKSGRYIGYWRLRTAEGQNFGHRIWADVQVTGGTADLVAEGSTMDGDWDLVNMQRLSKAVEDTAMDQQQISAAASSSSPTPENSETAPDAPVETPTTPPPAIDDLTGDTTINNTDTPILDGGMEEVKSSDEEGSGQVAESSGPRAGGGPSAAALKWHRELCSLAEMGFEDTVRNIGLLEKHVLETGNPGMERVLHELLSWHEVSFQ